MGIAVPEGVYYGDIEGDITVDEFLKIYDLPDNEGKKLELIDGHIVAMAGNANINHHRISGFLFNKIYNHLEGKPCEVFQDINVYLYNEGSRKNKNVFQPDIMVGCDRDKMALGGYKGAPDFIIEIISKSTSSNDYLLKTYHYMKSGVKEYWIVDLYQNLISVYINDGDDSLIVRAYTFNDEIKISILDDFNIDFNIDFKEILKIVDLNLK